jgi:hypothetical protein
MSISSRINIVQLRKWFPFDDALAGKIARLCVLREDLMIEMEALRVEEIKALDFTSTNYRKMYFLRNMIRTQVELSGALERLLNTQEFSEILKRAPRKIRTSFENAKKTIERVKALAKDVRNDICGHVQEAAVQDALERIGWHSWGFLDRGQTIRSTRYPFIGELVAEILLKDVMEHERRTEDSAKFADLSELIPLFAFIEVCFTLYARDRGLM